MGQPAEQISQTTQKTQWRDAVKPAYSSSGVSNFQDVNGNLIEGIYTDLPNDIYHSLPAISSSQLKKFAESPAHYYREYRSDIQRTRTLTTQRTFDTGSMGHELLLEPLGFTDRYFKMPIATDYPDSLHTSKEMSAKCDSLGLPKYGTKAELIDRLTKHDPSIEIYDVQVERILRNEAGDKAVDSALQWLKSTKGRTSLIRAFEEPSIASQAYKQPLDAILWDDAHRIAGVAREHPYIDRLIADGYPELAVIAKDPQTGLMLKCKFDWLRFDAIAVDVKTSRNAAPDKFARQAADLRYDLQQEFYKYVGNLQSIPVEYFVFTVIEYANADIAEPYELSDKDAHIGKADLHRYLTEFKTCDETNDWYGYSRRDRISVLNLPRRY